VINNYLTAWSADDVSELADDDLEIYGRFIVPEADLEITKTDGSDSIFVGENLTYTITVTNNGPDDALNVAVRDTFPKELEQISWSASGSENASGFETSGNGDINDGNIQLLNGDSVSYTVSAIVGQSVSAGTFLSNTADVRDLVALDPLPDNNVATDDDTEIFRLADLVIIKNDSRSSVSPGSELTYEIRVTNNGPHAAFNTTVVDTFPTELFDVSWTAQAEGDASGFESSGDNHITDGEINLGVGSTVIYTVFSYVDSSIIDSTLLVNTASVSDASAIDPDSSNNSSRDDDTWIVLDSTQPHIVVKKPKIIWPPNHKYKKIKLTKCIEKVEDNKDGEIPIDAVVIDSVSSDEPDDIPDDDDCGDHDEDDEDDDDDCDKDDEDDEDKDDSDYSNITGGDDIHKGRGHCNTKKDIMIDDDCRWVRLRAERQGKGNGRVYTIYVSVSDNAGNKATATCLVMVPHHKKKKAQDDGPAHTVVSACAEFDTVVSATENTELQLPKGFYLSQNYPNPFNPDTEFHFELPKPSLVIITIFNTLGQRIRTVTTRSYQAGYHQVRWNGTDNYNNRVPSGIYFYQMQADGFTACKKLILMK
jgi:uncharacterized repeat protein (TIGR01451 family)